MMRTTMRTNQLRVALVSAALAVWCVVPGCAPAPAPAPAVKPATVDRDHDDHADKDSHGDHDHDHDAERTIPDTFAGGIVELEKVVASVKGALAERNLDDADGHVHMVGHLVDDLHRLAKSAPLSDEAKAAAAKALDEVFECFDAMDTQLHASDEEVRKAIDYAKHEPRIEAAIKSLKGLATPAATAKEAARDADE